MTAALPPLADARAGGWVDRLAPGFARPYLRLSRADRPIGGWLLLWPCWWSAALVMLAGGRPGPDAWPLLVWHLLLFLAGAFLMRGAGCTYNDLVDRDIDALVERTRARPLPAGQVSPRAAMAWMVAQALLGLLVLVQFNAFAIGLGIASLGVVAAYPFMKRLTDWPQLVLGLAFSWGALMGWAGAVGRLGAAPLLLYAGSVAWVIGYDTIYALQDIEDDALVGVRSTARRFGTRVREAVAWLYAAAVALIGLALAATDAGLVAYLGLGLFLAHLVHQVIRLDPADGRACLAVFQSNREAGAWLFAGLVLEALLRSGPAH